MQPTPVFLPGEFHRQRCLVHGVAKNQTRLSDTLTFHYPQGIIKHSHNYLFGTYEEKNNIITLSTLLKLI